MRVVLVLLKETLSEEQLLVKAVLMRQIAGAQNG